MALHQTSRPYDWTFQRVVWATLVLVSVILCFWLLYRFYQVIFILFIAIVIGTVIRPVVNWLYQRGLSKIAGAILVYLVLLILLIGFFKRGHNRERGSIYFWKLSFVHALSIAYR